MTTAPDPLGVRAGSRFVMERARSVRIDDSAVHQVATRIANTEEPASSWAEYHLGDRQLTDDQLANFTLVLDSLNFYFWGEPRWRVTYAGETANGYRALTLALRRALEESFPITDAGYLATIPAHDVAMILRGESVIPAFPARVHHLREAGESLRSSFDGSFLNCIRAAGGSVPTLLRLIVTRFPSFVDVGVYQGRAIPFYKRAQILTSDLAGAFHGSTSVELHGLSALTAFADYKVPQVLQQLGVLRYSEDLTRSLFSCRTIPAGSPAEVEIRAATVIAVERIAGVLRSNGRHMDDYRIDWFLWDLGQSTSTLALPYHRTPTTAY